MPLKSLAYSADEIAEHKAEQAKYSVMPSDYAGPKYPWGLSITFEDASLAKMGMDAKDFKPGEEMPIAGTLRITGISMNEREDGTKSQCVNAVLVAIDTSGPAKTTAQAADTIYGKSGE